MRTIWPDLLTGFAAGAAITVGTAPVGCTAEFGTDNALSGFGRCNNCTST